jgi:hypothetical protein
VQRGVLATYDPALPPDLADQLSHDTGRLVRTAAIQHPNLPLARIRELLTEPSVIDWFVEAETANPSLPVKGMHHILDEQLVRNGYQKADEGPRTPLSPSSTTGPPHVADSVGPGPGQCRRRTRPGRHPQPRWSKAHRGSPHTQRGRSA